MLLENNPSIDESINPTLNPLFPPPPQKKKKKKKKKSLGTERKAVENIVGKGENAGNEHFLPSPYFLSFP